MLLETAAAQAMRRAAERSGADEMVGLVGGREAAGALRVVHFAPLRGASCSRDRFTVAPWHFAAAEAALRDAGLAWLGFAHSHPHGAPVPSPTDAEQLWPHCLQLVLGSAPGSARGATSIRAWWRDAEGFHERPLRTGGSA